MEDSISCRRTTGKSSSRLRFTPAHPRIPRAARPSGAGTAQLHRRAAIGLRHHGRTIFTNGIDAVRLGTQSSYESLEIAPTGGPVTATSIDLATERWRHERPTIPEMGGTPGKQMYRDVGGHCRLRHRGRQWCRLFHGRSQWASSSPSRRPRVVCSTRSSSGRSLPGCRSLGDESI